MRHNMHVIIRACLIGLTVLFSIFAGPSAQAKNESIEFSRMTSGQYLIDVMLNGQGPYTFMIDSAATRTSIFEKTRLRLGIEKNDGVEAFVSGMTESELRPTANVSSLSFGTKVFTDHKIVILDDWTDPAQLVDGILGIEILNDLVLAFSHKNQKIQIREKFYPRSRKYRNWNRIPLISNPYPIDDYGLLFTGAKIGETLIPAMMDTGSNFTTISWNSVEGTELDKEKQRLKEEWLVQGAVGEFKPLLRITLDKFNVGGIDLPNHELLIMDFDEFPISGNGKYPLIIAGVDVIGGRDFVFDFKEKILYVEPRKKS